jgi:SAM-dependent methyltransferase
VTPAYDQTFWEQLWAKTLREHGDAVAHRPPNAELIRAATSLEPRRALDAGCGHGAESLWLAAHGWQVTAVDFSASALAKGRALAEAGGVSARIEWVEGDLATWRPPADAFELVLCLYVHVAGSMDEFIARMAGAVAVGGTLLMVGHRPIDPATGAATRAAGQQQVSVERARAVLEPSRWALSIAEDRPRAVAGSGVDAVILGRRLG